MVGAAMFGTAMVATPIIFPAARSDVKFSAARYFSSRQRAARSAPAVACCFRRCVGCFRRRLVSSGVAEISSCAKKSLLAAHKTLPAPKGVFRQSESVFRRYAGAPPQPHRRTIGNDASWPQNGRTRNFMEDGNHDPGGPADRLMSILVHRRTIHARCALVRREFLSACQWQSPMVGEIMQERVHGCCYNREAAQTR
jgi:hypothetical protein